MKLRITTLLILLLCFNVKAQNNLDFQELIHDMTSSQPVIMGEAYSVVNFHVHDLYELHAKGDENYGIHKRKTNQLMKGFNFANISLSAGLISLGVGIAQEQKAASLYPNGTSNPQEIRAIHEIQDRAQLFHTTLALPLTMGGGFLSVKRLNKSLALKKTLRSLQHVFEQKDIGNLDTRYENNLLKAIVIHLLDTENMHKKIAEYMTEENPIKKRNKEIYLVSRINETALNTILALSQAVSVDEEKISAKGRAQIIGDLLK